ncbi:MAG: peptidylprolyl isomerase [Saprospiraceae bacterium]|uniref:Peptidylprolyl isomerase n=1 Tax=Candidatus Opimibacter skivensis TaxID=2982028 RepID=A0A9D7SXF2_9BACT|nr:peptidylprolyl isomerase [Candidatus Opimibacter skivensis]
MKKMILKSAIFSLFVISYPLLQAQDTIVLDKIIAKVGGEVIFHSDVEEQMAMMRERKATPGDAERCLILESLMAQAMLVHYAKIDSVEVTDDQVESEIDSRMNQILSMMNNDRKMFQDVYGQTVSEMREQVKDDMLRKLLADKMRAEIMNKVGVTPSEVVDFYHRIPADSLPYFNAEVELAEIVIKPKVNQEERAKALQKINSIKDQIKAGADFEELARKYSDDGSAKDGGNLGWTTRGNFVPEFEGAAFQLEKGQISDVVESEFGFHIIQLIERRVNSINTRHILIRPRITDPDLEKTKNKLDSIKHLIEIDTMTFADAVHKFGDKKVQSFSNNGRMINPKTSNTFFETGDVDSEIFFNIDTLSVGEITPPIQYRTPLGDYEYKIVQLQGRTSPHLANLKQDYSRIQDAARESKRNLAFGDWLSKKLASTYILIDPQYRQCPNIEHWQAKWMSYN